MIYATRTIAFSEDDLEIAFVRSSGPGGQNVNKVSSAVQLRVDLARLSGLGDEARDRLRRLAGKRLTTSDSIVITANRFRTQDLNRRDALERLIALIRQAAIQPVKRKSTRPTLGAKRRRLQEKERRAATKALRGAIQPD